MARIEKKFVEMVKNPYHVKLSITYLIIEIMVAVNTPMPTDENI
jgi:hypothetical protein